MMLRFPLARLQTRVLNEACAPTYSHSSRPAMLDAIPAASPTMCLAKIKMQQMQLLRSCLAASLPGSENKRHSATAAVAQVEEYWHNMSCGFARRSVLWRRDSQRVARICISVWRWHGLQSSASVAKDTTTELPPERWDMDPLQLLETSTAASRMPSPAISHCCECQKLRPAH